MPLFSFPTAEMWRRNLVVCGLGTAKQFHSPPSTLSLKAVLQGKATYRCNGRSYALDEDLLLITGCGDSYLLEVDSPAPSETLGVFFRPGFVESHAVPLSESDQSVASPILPRLFARESRHDRLIRGIKNVEESSSYEEMEREVYYHQLATLMVVEDHRARSEQSLLDINPTLRDEMARRMSCARDMILQDSGKAWTLESLAETAFLSAFHFHRLFRQFFGVTPHQLLTQERLRRVNRLLTRTDLPISDIAAKVGFANEASLHRLYKRAYGTSPRKAHPLRKQD